MSSKNQQNKKNVKAQGGAGAKMPVEKPDATHMPKCANFSCNRKVSDARQTKCGHCSTSASNASDYIWDMYDY